MSKKPSLFTIIFEDGSNFKGGKSYYDTKWTEIPYRKIKRVLYRLPGGDYLCLDHYDNYFHMIEATTDLNGENKGKTNIQYAYLMGKKGTNVIVYQIGLAKQKNLGHIMKYILKDSNEKIQKLNPNNWR